MTESLESKLQRGKSIKVLDNLGRLAVTLAIPFLTACGPSNEQPPPRFTTQTQSTGLSIPSKYGTVISVSNPEATRRLYVISRVHRKMDGTIPYPEMPKIMVESYRIAVSIIQQTNIDLILPEGYVESKSYTSQLQTMESDLRNQLGTEYTTLQSGTDEHLAQFLMRAVGSLHAAELVALFHNVNSQGVENQRTLNEAIQAVYTKPANEQLIRYLNQVRSFWMLYRAPTIITREHKAGRIKTDSSIIFIGEEHIPDMVAFVKHDYARIDGFDSQHPTLEQSLMLREKGYGVTIIQPASMPAFRRKYLNK